MYIHNISELKFFTEKWVGKRLPVYGLTEDEIPQDLPGPLKELYLFAGNWPSLNSTITEETNPVNNQNFFKTRIIW